MKHEIWIIKDWAGNDLTYHHGEFKSFDDAEEALSIFLGDEYETDRGEYVITRLGIEYTGSDMYNRYFGGGK